jgi:hypothetical protein
VDEVEQMMQLIEMVLVEIGKKSSAPRRMAGKLQIVNMGVPVLAEAFVQARLTIWQV